MGRLCGGTHEISGIKAPLFLHGWVGGSGVGGGGVVIVRWVGGGGVGGGGVGVWWVVWCAGEGCCGWWTKGG